MAKKNAVQVVEKNPGTKIAWEQDGTKLIFGDDELMVNAAKRQKDWPVHEDICADDSGNLVIGVGVGRYYVAQVDIPAREYLEVPNDEPEAVAEGGEDTGDGEASGASGASEDGGTDGMNTPKTHLEAQPLDMSKVTLTLWSLDGLKANS